jgi:hypothetical protein
MQPISETAQLLAMGPREGNFGNWFDVFPYHHLSSNQAYFCSLYRALGDDHLLDGHVTS